VASGSAGVASVTASSVMNILISVITCRRPAGLSRLLNGIGNLRASSDVTIEVLVVDNACDEEARSVVEAAQRTDFPFALTYVEEPEPGIVAARNRCVAFFLNSGADALAFIDDDEWPAESDWMLRLVSTMMDARADVVTGSVISVAEADTPKWALQVLYPPTQLTPGAAVPTFYTNNVLIKRDVLERIAPAFDRRFAMTGASDYHFALKARRAGFRAVYADAPVEESFPANRATLKWFLRRGYRSGIGFTRSHLFEERLLIAIPRCCALALVRALSGVVQGLLGVVTNDMSRRVRGGMRLASAYGSLVGFFGVTYEEYRVAHDS
jgi:succinoglycan biosynthesis protein ExoM